jgi:hypothetical protein
MQLAVIKSNRNQNTVWVQTAKQLQLAGIPVNDVSVESDAFVVLSGQMENPLCLRGKRILFFRDDEWFPSVNRAGWEHWYKPLLKEYYHEMVDCSADTPQQMVDRVRALLDAEGR